MKTYEKKFILKHFKEGGYHFFVECKINGIKSYLTIDSGASMSIFDKNSEIFKELVFSKMDGEQHSFNSSDFEILIGKIESFVIGKFKTSIKNAAFSSFDYINKIYKEQGVPEVIGLLGADFLLKNKVVLDFSRKKMIVSY